MLHKDNIGVICQPRAGGKLECGDGLCWTSHHTYLTDSAFPLSIFEVGFGAYVRHPDPAMTDNGFGAYYKNPWDGCISRDQLTGLIAALIKQERYQALRRVMLHHALRGFLFSYNTIDNGVEPKTAKKKLPDFTGPDIWAMYLRSFGWIFWPLLVVLDIHLLLNTVVMRFKKDIDCINYLIKFFVTQEFVPTPTGWLAKKILPKDKLIRNVRYYWSGWRDQAEMAELYVRRLEEL